MIDPSKGGMLYSGWKWRNRNRIKQSTAACQKNKQTKIDTLEPSWNIEEDLLNSQFHMDKMATFSPLPAMLLQGASHAVGIHLAGVVLLLHVLIGRALVEKTDWINKNNIVRSSGKTTQQQKQQQQPMFQSTCHLQSRFDGPTIVWTPKWQQACHPWKTHLGPIVCIQFLKFVDDLDNKHGKLESLPI